jgi:parallel beta-helix repeat protein
MLHTKVNLAAGVAVFIGLIAIVSNPAWADDITKCGAVIDQPGDYHLAQDLTCSTPLTIAIHIVASDVTLHLDGHTLSGGGTGDVGILVGFFRNGPVVSGVTIQGGTVTNFFGDVFLVGVTDSKLVNVDAVDTVPKLQSAIVVKNSNDNSIINCTASGSVSDGITLQNANDNTLISNTTNNNNRAGISILDFGSGATNNIVRANSVQNNGVGIDVVGTANLIQANKVFGNSIVDLYDSNSSCDSNVWKSNKFGSANRSCIQ